MGKHNGFLVWPREAPPTREVSVRTQDSAEFIGLFPAERSRQQAGRCMDCAVPFCHQGCPLGNAIPDFNERVWRGQWEAAYHALAATNDFPEFTGRLCPAPCEAACVLAINDDAVTIEQIEKEIIERAFAEGWVVPRPPRQRTGQRVAVVGSGPAGLAAANQLNRAGHHVTVLERDDQPGGLLRSGIPDFKLDKHLIDRRLEILRAEGIEFRCGVRCGVDPDWATLVEAFDAVVLAMGARRPRDLTLPGRPLRGVSMAMDYLERQNRLVSDRPLGGPFDSPDLDAAGKRVIILGGGDTGSDCLGTAHRQGAAQVRQIELFPAPPAERRADNPWPRWPRVFRTTSSQAEGGDRQFALETLEFQGEAGHVTGIRVRQVELISGELMPVQDSEHVLPADLVLLALGYVGPEVDGLIEIGVTLDQRGNVEVDGQYRTAHPKIYAAGDAVRGASLIVWAISEGREAARVIDATLRDAVSPLPTRGEDRPFE